MSGIDYNFDATQFTPQQSVGTHPPGKFPFEITGVEAKPSKEGGNGYVAVTFSTPAGSIIKRYNFWNLSQQAVDIAHREMSALCHAIGVFRWSLRDNGAALMRARGMIEVGPQVDRNTGQPNGYNEVKRVFDANGNDPTKPLTQQPQGFGQNAPQQMPQQGLAPASQTHPGAFPVDTGPMPGQMQPNQPWAAPPQQAGTPLPVPQAATPQAVPGQPWASQPMPQAAVQPSWQPQQQQQAQPQAAPAWAQQR